MRIVVCVKQGLDPQSVKISRSREELDLRDARMRTQPEDKHALEAGLRLKEAQGGDNLSSSEGLTGTEVVAGSEGLTGSEVIAVVVGGRRAEDSAREAVAMGADKAVHVLQKGLLTGKAVTPLFLAAIERLGGADLILAGQSGDMDPVGPLAGRLAAALDRPLVMDVLAFEAGPEGLWAVSWCDGGGAVRVPVALPAVAVVMSSAERPRYPHPARIAVAWNNGYVETWTADDLGVPEEQLALDAEMGGLVLGAERERGQVLSGTPADAAAELVGILTGKRLLEQAR